MSAMTPHSALDPFALGLGEVAQHVAVHQLLDARMADAEAHAAIIVADMGRDRAQAVVAGIAAAVLDAHLRRRQVDLVVQHDDVLGAELVEMRGLADRLARTRS